jgi:hypothetical protein
MSGQADPDPEVELREFTGFNARIANPLPDRCRHQNSIYPADLRRLILPSNPSKLLKPFKTVTRQTRAQPAGPTYFWKNVRRAWVPSRSIDQSSHPLVYDEYEDDDK